MKYKTIEELKGETLTLVENNTDEIVFTCESGRRFLMYHEQECCETVEIGSIEGELSNLVGSPILITKEEPGREIPGSYDSRVTFTDFILETSQAQVIIHWIGESNGYYSESVYFAEL